MTPMNPDFNNLIAQHSQLISSLEQSHFGDFSKKRKVNQLSVIPSFQAVEEMKNEIEHVVCDSVKRMKEEVNNDDFVMK